MLGSPAECSSASSELMAIRARGEGPQRGAALSRTVPGRGAFGAARLAPPPALGAAASGCCPSRPGSLKRSRRRGDRISLHRIQSW
eukprot:5368343-Pyramimonas_sp.AAC.1